ncbi:hypothetical protein R3P38DRAFT_3102073 [Favolaschia claudopus]|uniref:Uncharacterized protein n=1 Tax=Favolaschia claudopus TaxID=2862362 RepID=A0AAV9ZLN1_9AGAR
MSENTGSIGKRTVASVFKRGNSINIAFAGSATIMWVVQKYYYRRLNRKNGCAYATLNEEAKAREDREAEKKGNRSLTFRFTT